MNYSTENGIVYDNHTTDSGSIGQICIGNEIQYSTTETDSQTIYQWQKFNIDTGQYENDTTNTTQILGITPTNGQVVIDKLPEVKTNQKQLIMDAYDNALAAGFTSSASGTAIQYPYNTQAEQTFDELYLAVMGNKVTYPTNVYDINDNAVSFASSAQLTQLFTDIFSFKAGLNTKMHNYLTQIDSCTDVDNVQNIIWS